MTRFRFLFLVFVLTASVGSACIMPNRCPDEDPEPPSYTSYVDSGYVEPETGQRRRDVGGTILEQFENMDTNDDGVIDSREWVDAGGNAAEFVDILEDNNVEEEEAISWYLFKTLF